MKPEIAIRAMWRAKLRWLHGILRRLQSADGSAFAAILLPLLILAALAGTATQGARTDLLVARAAEAELQSRLAAEAGIASALLRLLAPENAESWVADGSVFKTRFAGFDVEVFAQNEQAKINLDQVPNQPLERLLVLSCVGPAEARRLAGRVADYVDEDDIAREGGDERNTYAKAGLGHEPANRRFETSSELLRVPGMSPSLYARLKPFITAYGYHAIPELRLASAKTVMSVLGVDEKAAEAVRSRPQGGPSASSVGVFTLEARVATPGRPPGATRAVVYATGDRTAPLRILDWRRASDPEAGDLACAKNGIEEQ